LVPSVVGRYETQIKARSQFLAWELLEVARLYDRLMRFDKGIRFAAVVDARGRILEGGMREGLEPIEPLEKTPHLIAKLVSILKAEDLNEFFGKPEHSILIHEKLVVFIFRSGSKFVLVTANRKFGVNKAARLGTIIRRK
jgi:hypothetical protein